MKRFFAALLAALMVFSLVTIPAVAEGEVVFEVPTVNAQPGDTVSIPVTLTGSNFECHAMNMNVQYDAEALTLNSATEGDAISGATMKVLDTESELGKVKLGLLYAYDGMTAGGTLFTMNFTVNENATGNAALTINVVTFANMPAGSTTATPIAYIANNGAVVVGQPETPIPETDTPAPETPIPETPAPGEEMTLDEALNVQGGTLHFENDANYPFVVENDYVKSSNQGQGSTQPGVTTTVNLAASKLLSFNYKVSSEANWDYVFVSIDGTVVAPTDADSKYILSGDRAAEWLNYTYIVPEGEHTVTIGYRKDSSGDRLDDTAWLDEIQFMDIVNVTGVEFSQDALTMPLARTAQLEWTVLPADAANKNVTFASDNTEVATVNKNGLVTSVAPGTVNITVTTVDGGFTDVIAVTVEEAVAVTEIVIAPAAITIPVATSVTETLVANVIPENATDTTVAWTSEDETIATVSVNGQIKGIAPGTVTINATSANGVTGTCEVTVVAPEDFPGLDSINFTSMNPLPYDNFEVGIGPGYGTPVLIQRGNTNTLTYTYATGFSINVEAGQKIYFNTYWYGGTPGGSNDPNRKDTFMTLYDSEFNYLDHNDDGSAFGIAPYSGIEYVFETAGTYYVVVTPYNHASNNGNGKGLVEMHAAEVLPTEIETIELADFSMFTGTNTNIIDRAVFTPAEYEISDFVFTSSNEAVASIDADGKVHALAEGTTTITITDNVSGATASAVLTVNEISEDDYAMIVLNVNAGETGVFQDGSGYQMLLDADAAAYGNEIPAQGPLTTGGDAPAGLYDVFEYKIPENADGILTTSNIVVSGMDYVLVPAGTYDWCITNPTPGDRIWIASDSGSIGGRANDYTFEAGNTYTFTVSLDGQYDRTDITVTPGIEEPTPTATPAITPTPTPAPTPDPGATGWGFETDPFAEGWTIRDDDGDGYNWEWMDASDSDYNVYEGTHCMASASYQNSAFGGGTALNPDNWLISPAFTAGSTVTFWYAGQDPSYSAEPFGVYVIANGTTSAELGHFTASDTYQQGSVDISDFAGQTVQVAFRHYDITDMFRLNLDLVEVSGGGSTPNTPVPPTENPVTPEPGTVTGWGFETDPFAEGWTVRDDDGDGFNWEWIESATGYYNIYEGTHCMSSVSYDNETNTALTPDNWLISPEFVAGSTVTFWYAGQDPDYAAEPFGVYVIANGTASAELGHFTASDTYQQGSVDISAYAGQTVQVAFRHYNITDMFRLNLDLVEVSGGGETPTENPVTPVPPTTIPEPTLVPHDVTFSAAAPASVAAGEEFQVAVNIGGVIDYEAHVLNLRLDYDTDAFEYLHDEPGAVMNQMIENSGTAILDGFSIPGSIRFGAMMPNAGFTAYGTLFTLTFRAKADAVNGEHNFDLNVVEFNNFPMGGTSTPIEHTDVDAIVEVTGGSTVTPTPTEVPTPTPGPGSDLDEAMNVAGGTLHFTTDGDYPWIVEETWGKSTNINVASSTSTVSTTVTAAAGDILQFDFRSFGEGSGNTVWDGLHLFIDGTEVAKWNRVETWTTYAVELTAGEHTITWTYQKDSSVDKEGDYANVDNVYVGAPVVPTSIEVENVTVPAGRRATVAYTVLPAEAFNKNVTFSIANTAIATVNENGVVVGVAEGTTTVTVTSVADPTVSGSATVTVTEALPTVNLEGYIAFDPEGTSGIWGGFADYDPSVIENFGAMGSTFGGAFAGGNVYGFMYDSDTNDTRFYIMNADTHQVAYPGTSAGRVVVAMAYNHAEGEMYAIAANDADGRSLYTVNLATGTLTEVAALNAGAETIMTLAIDGSGNAYGLSYEATNAVLYSINLTNGNCTAIGGTGHGLEYVQSTVWDHNTNQLFWAQYSKVDNDKGQLFVIDPATGAATLCGTIGTGAEVTVLYTKNNMPVAPIEVPEYDVIFVDGLTNEPIPGGYTVEAGTILDEADFPTPPEHEGYVFTGWDYNGAPVYSDLTIKARYRDPSATTATISLTVGDVWGDGSGYQMLLDADATAFGNEIPAEGPLTQSGNAPAGLYDAFEYKIPVNADGSTTTSNIVINNTVTIEVPAGTYDWCIANPTPGDRIWIASAQGNIGGRADDYEFEAGYTYNFTVYLLGQNDATDVEIIPGGGETPVITDSPTPVITNSPTPEPPTDTPEPGDETPTPEIPTDAPTPEIPTDVPEPVTPAPGDVIFSVGGVHYVAAGSQVNVDLTINGEYEANGMNIWVQYDAENLTLNNVENGEIMNAIGNLGGMNILDFTSIPGSVRLGSMLPTNPVSGSGTIFTMNFTVAEGLEDGTELPIEILVKEFFNMPVGGENTPIAFFAENGAIVVGSEPIVTDEPGVTDEPTAVPTDAPNPPITGAMSLIGVGIAAIVASVGVVIFRKKEED